MSEVEGNPLFIASGLFTGNRERMAGREQGGSGKLREGLQLQRCQRAPSEKKQRGSRQGSGKPRQ